MQTGDQTHALALLRAHASTRIGTSMHARGHTRARTRTLDIEDNEYHTPDVDDEEYSTPVL